MSGFIISSNIGSIQGTSPTGETIKKQKIINILSVINSVIDGESEYVTDGSVLLDDLKKGDNVVVTGSPVPENNGKFAVIRIESDSIFLDNGNAVTDLNPCVLTFDYKIYALHTKNVGGAVVPGDNPAIALEITYAEYQTLRDTASLQAGLYYKITDFNTVVNANLYNTIDTNPSIQTGSIEPLVVQAISPTKLSTKAFSELFPNDDIEYDADIDAIYQEQWGYIEDGVNDSGAAFTMSVQSSTQMLVNAKISVFDAFELELEDDNNYYYFEALDEGTGFTLTDNGNGTTTINILQPIDFVGSSSYWLYTGANVEVASMPGKITYRKNRTRNIEANCDFRNNVKTLYRLDLTDTTKYPVWNNTLVPTYKSFCQHNGDVYIYMPHESTATIRNIAPTHTGNYWALFVQDAQNAFIFANTSQVQNNIVLDELNPKLVPMIGAYDASTQTFYPNKLDAFEDISLLDESIVCLSKNVSYITHSNIKIANGAYRISLFGNSIHDLELISGSYDFQVGLYASVNNLFTPFRMNKCLISYTFAGNKGSYLYGTLLGYVLYSEFGYNIQGSMFQNTNYSKFGSSTNRINIGYAWSLEVGDISSNFYLRYAYKLKFGTGAYYVRSYAVNNFKNSSFGNETRRVTFEEGAYLDLSNFGNRFGQISGEQRIAYEMRNVKTGDNFNALASTITDYIRYTTFGDNCNNFTANRIYGCTFGNNCFSWVSGNIINNTTSGNNVSIVKGTVVGIQNCRFDNNMGNIEAKNIYNSSFEAGCSGINVPNAEIGYSTFKSGSYIRYDGTIDIIEVLFNARIFLVVATSANWMANFYTKEIFKNVSGTIRGKYTDATDNLVYFDPTV